MMKAHFVAFINLGPGTFSPAYITEYENRITVSYYPTAIKATDNFEEVTSKATKITKECKTVLEGLNTVLLFFDKPLATTYELTPDEYVNDRLSDMFRQRSNVDYIMYEFELNNREVINDERI